MDHPASVDDLVRALTHSAARPMNALCGAGISYPAPTADDIKKALLLGLSSVISDVSEERKNRLAHALSSSYMTLELTFALFEAILDGPASETDFFKPNEIMRIALNERESDERLQTTPGNLAVALLRKVGAIQTIASPNFDTILIRTLNRLNESYRIVTPRQLRTNGSALRFESSASDVFTYHGTLVDSTIGFRDLSRGLTGEYSTPSTLVARGLMRPLDPERAEYMKEVFGRRSGRSLLVFGYSGRDYFDVNGIFEELISAENGSTELADLHWTLFQGDVRRDVSGFIAHDIQPRFYQGDFAASVLDHLLGYRTGIPDSRLQLDQPADSFLSGLGINRAGEGIAAKYFVEDRPGFDAERVGKAIFEPPSIGPNASLFIERGKLLVAALENNLAGAWAVAEHYAMESYGFSQRYIRHLGGVSGGTESQVINFHGLNLSMLLDAQETYWTDVDDLASKKLALTSDEASRTKVSADPERMAELFFGNTLSAFASAEREVSLTLEGQLPKLDRAMLLTLKSITLDYQGLVWNRVSQMVPHQFRAACAQRAVGLFRDTRSLNEQAADVLAAKHLPGHAAIRHVVPFWIWGQVGQDNTPRPMLVAGEEVEHIIAHYRDILKSRLSVIRALESDGEHEEGALFLIPQTALRSAEAFRTIVSCEGNQNAPLPPRPADQLLLKGFLESAVDLRDIYERSVSIRNHLFIAVYDCEIIDATLSSSDEVIRHTIDRCVTTYGSRQHDNRTASFLRNLGSRLETIAKSNYSVANAAHLAFAQLSKTIEVR